jgi:hypothetical protein
VSVATTAAAKVAIAAERIPAIACCPLCDEPLELVPVTRELACGCSRPIAPLLAAEPRRCVQVDSKERGSSCVPPLAFQIVIERYGFDGDRPRTVEEVARRHRLSRARVRELEGRVLVALRKILR